MELKKEDINKLKKARFSPKEVLAYFSLGFLKTKTNNVDEIVKNVVIQMITVKKIDALEKINNELLSLISNNWQLSFTEVVAYAYIVFSNLKTANRPIYLLHIIQEFNAVMRLYSPNNAEEFVERNNFDIYN